VIDGRRDARHDRAQERKELQDLVYFIDVGNEPGEPGKPNGRISYFLRDARCTQ
jgi:hypothetical protein